MMTLSSMIIALPEIFVTLMIIVMLLVDAFIRHSTKCLVNQSLAFATLGIAFILEHYVYQYAILNHLSLITFNGMFILDNMARFMKTAIFVLSAFILAYSNRYIINRKIPFGEFSSIFMFAILGMMVMISAYNLLILYIGLELLSLALYGMVAINREHSYSSEAAIKFFILGSLASGLLLYGISFIYGITQSLQLDIISHTISLSSSYSRDILIFGLVFIVSGLAFKLGLAPFHMWLPDTYEGSALPTTIIIATITKLAALIFTLRFLVFAFQNLSIDWSFMLIILGVISIVLGNIIAIAQTNLKRMLGYSTIANMGFVAFGLMTINLQGVQSVIFFMFSYVLSLLAAFGILTLFSNADEDLALISDLKGFSRQHPFAAILLSITMLSMAGLPPTIGFYGKFYVIEAMINAGYIKLAVLAVIMSLIGAFYYLRIIKVMYFETSDSTFKFGAPGVFRYSLLSINSLAVIVLGVVPQYLLSYSALLLS